MPRVTGLPFVRPFLDENMLFTSEGRAAFDEIVSRIPITGEGPPENIVEARAGATYYDLIADSGSIHYVKVVNVIDNDGTRGWKLA